MASKWPIVKVGDFADSISDTHKLGKDRLVFLNTSDVLLGKLLNHSYSAVRDWPGQAKKSIRKGDILFSEIRPANGRWAYVDINADDYVVSTKLMVIRSRANHILPRFLYHFLTSTQTTSWLQHLAESRSGTFPQITFDQVAELELALPPLTVQVKSASFLDALDNKIELNRRMSQTVEAIARALFKSWFVDFDPVRAKAEGRDPGLPKPLADLFPDSFEDSELGGIPKGWVVGTLGVLGELAIGGDWGEDHSFAGAVEANCLRGVDLEHLRKSGQASPPRRWFKPSSLERRAMDDRDVLVAGSGAGPTGRSLWMCTSLVSALGPSIYSNFCKRIRCGTAAGALYLDAWLHEMRQSGEIWEYVNGTSVPNLDASSLLAGKEIPIPPIAVLDSYYGFVRPIREKLYSGQNRTLATLRDTLLPKLISGELRIEDAKRIIERATA